jgi:hypothetical protein
MARDYYDSIQTKDCPDEYSRMMATNITLEKCSVQLSKMEFDEIDKDLTTGDISEALRLGSPRGWMVSHMNFINYLTSSSGKAWELPHRNSTY